MERASSCWKRPPLGVPSLRARTGSRWYRYRPVVRFACRLSMCNSMVLMENGPSIDGDVTSRSGYFDQKAELVRTLSSRSRRGCRPRWCRCRGLDTRHSSHRPCSLRSCNRPRRFRCLRCQHCSSRRCRLHLFRFPPIPRSRCLRPRLLRCRRWGANRKSSRRASPARSPRASCSERGACPGLTTWPRP